MRRTRRGADNAGIACLAAAEDLGENPPRRHAEGSQRLFHVCHEAVRSAEIDIRLPGDADLVERRSRQAAGRVEILAHPVARGGLAVANKAAAVRERAHEAADLGGKRMMLPIARRVQPQYLPY